MKRALAFPLDAGGSVLVEVEDAPGPATRGLRPADLPEKARQSFEGAIDTIRLTATAMIGKLRDLADKPDEIEVEFGLKLSAEAGAVIASTAGEAHFTVRLAWTRGQDK